MLFQKRYKLKLFWIPKSSVCSFFTLDKLFRMVQYLDLQKLSKIFLKYEKKAGSWPDSILKKEQKRRGFAIMLMHFIFIER